MNKNSGHIDDKLLLRFLLGEATKDEMQQVQEWLQLSKENRNLLDSYETLWAESGKLTPNPVAVDTPLAWKKMSDRIDQYEEQKSTKTISLRSRFILISSSIAAAIIILFGVYQLLIKQPQQIMIASAEEVLNDTLPDGTNIVLNENSNITYPEKFARKERRVKIEGEAFFNVEPNKEKPFIIEAGNAYVQVLGTSFNVKAYENSELEVIVTDGLVKVFTVNSETMDTTSILLKAGEKGRILAEKREPVYVAENIPDELFWMDYTLIFNDTDLKKVFSLLENYYNIDIEVSDEKIYDCRLSTTFTNNSINDIIEVITATFEFEYTKENNTFTIKGDGCAEKNI
ncbi:FecR family protein [Bacteroidota bacterium]